MVERDITASNGILSKNLPLGWYWFRFPDTGGRKRNSIGADGLLLFGKHIGYFIEVKLGNGQLTESEKKLCNWCHSNNRPYFLLAYYESKDTWKLEDLVFNNIKVGPNLKEIIEELCDY